MDAFLKEQDALTNIWIIGFYFKIAQKFKAGGGWGEGTSKASGAPLRHLNNNLDIILLHDRTSSNTESHTGLHDTDPGAGINSSYTIIFHLHAFHPGVYVLYRT